MILSLLRLVGITGLEPATSRPPGASQLAPNPAENQLITLYCFLSVYFSVYFCSPIDETLF